MSDFVWSNLFASIYNINWPNDRKILRQDIATLLGTACCARLATLLRRVATCWLLFSQNLKRVKFFMQHLWMLYDVVFVWPGSCNNFTPGHAPTSSIFNTSSNTVTTWWQSACNMLCPQCCVRPALKSFHRFPGLVNAGPTMLWYFVLKYCDHLAGA